MNELKTEIAGIIEYYYESESHPNRLWEIVCDNLDLNYEDETAGKIFDEIFDEITEK